MDEQLELFNLRRAGRGRPRIYNWSLWLNGHEWVLTEGEDFQVDVEAFRTRVQSQGRSQGFHVKTHRVNHKTISIRAIRPQSSQAPE